MCYSLLSTNWCIYGEGLFAHTSPYNNPVNFFHKIFFKQGLHTLKGILIRCEDNSTRGISVKPMNGLNMVILKIRPQLFFKAIWAVCHYIRGFCNNQVMIVFKQDTILFKFLGFDFSCNNLNHIPLIQFVGGNPDTLFVHKNQSSVKELFCLIFGYG